MQRWRVKSGRTVGAQSPSRPPQRSYISHVLFYIIQQVHLRLSGEHIFSVAIQVKYAFNIYVFSISNNIPKSSWKGFCQNKAKKPDDALAGRDKW